MVHIVIMMALIMLVTIAFGIPFGFALTVGAMLFVDLRFAMVGLVMLFLIAVYLIYKQEVEEL